MDDVATLDERAAGTRSGLAAGLPPGPAGDRLAEAFASVPDHPSRVLAIATEVHAAAVAEGDARGAAWAQTVVGFAHYLRSDHRTALAAFTDALATLESLGDLAGRAAALDGLASVHTSLGHYEDAVEAAEQSLAATRSLGHVEAEAWTLQGLANLMLELDDPAQALRLGGQALAHFEALGRPSGQARALVVVGGAHRLLGAPDAAQRAFTDALALARAEGAHLTEARVLDDLGRIDADAGRTEAAIARFREALTLREATGNRQAQATSRLHLGEAYASLGHTADAVETLAAGLALAEATGAAPREAELHRALATAYEAADNPAQALAHLRQHQAVRERLLSAQARSRVETLRMRAEAERAQRDAEMARVRTIELGTTNRELEATLGRLHEAQSRLVQTEKMASLGRLSAGLAHEIRNPLNFVLNFADVAASLAVDVRARLAASDVPAALAAETTPDLDALVESAERVRLHALRAEGVVQSLVGHARTERSVARAPVDLPTLLDAVLAEALPSGSDIQVVRRFGPALPPVVGDAAALRQTLAALVTNAVRVLDESPPAGAVPTLTLAAELDGTSGGPVVRVVVTDNGPGIPTEHHGRIFEPFFSTRPTGQGTGLGLALAYDAVVSGHGGRLTVESQPGEGAAFTVCLPVGGAAPSA